MSEGLEGTVEFVGSLSEYAKKSELAYTQAMVAEMTIEMQESMARTPVDTGDLRDSHRLSEPEILDGTISVHIIVGEGLGVYPIIQHESLELNHPNGGQAKFLESTLLESSPFMAERIGNRASGQATSGGEQGLGESE